MPIVVIIVIAAIMACVFVAGRRPDESRIRSRSAHPSGMHSSSVHIVHLGRED